MFLHDALTVAKKELKAFFSDKAILAQILILPFAVVFGYSLLMSSMNSTVEDEDSSDSGTGTSAYSVKGTAYAVNIPDFMQQGFDEMGFKTAEEADAESIRKDISQELAQLLVIFPEDFKFPETAEDKLCDIEIWYNIENDDSFEAYSLTTSYLSSYRPTLYTINSSDKKYDLGDSSAFFREFMGTILPIMIITGVFTVCMNLAAETIAGDKERGFLNTMLIAPVKRSSIAAGKSIAIFVASALGGLSACIGMAAGLPKLAKMFAGSDISITYRV
ncbi:MAG: ABC transporter permease, partial [Oscillospiraceae bacterium]|nr:ABC transporter permease [Oscillospiraceae bacterium]